MPEGAVSRSKASRSAAASNRSGGPRPSLAILPKLGDRHEAKENDGPFSSQLCPALPQTSLAAFSTGNGPAYFVIANPRRTEWSERFTQAKECLPGMAQKPTARQVLHESNPIDLYDYTCWLRSRAMRAPHEAPAPIIVTDDWPQEVPITDPELRVIEAYFAEELDDFLGPRV